MTGRLVVRNYRGREVPAVLGPTLGAFGAASTISIALLDSAGVPSAGWVASGAALLVLAAGLVDDLAPAGPRGIGAHLAALARGHVTTGILKLVVLAAASIVAVAALPGGSGPVRLAGAVLVAGCGNLFNGLDVRPGRAIKFFLLAAILGALWFPWELAPFAPGVGLGALVLLPWDAGERAMLGDSGANLLGFTIGIGLYGQLSDAWVFAGAAIAVALNVLAETVTLSRVIDAIPPLRWFDRLGRAVED
jgi:UDP-GlcNAc:undecaprenyl-phosphate/decaprenyl-phosphate GlcNAc-1-phosphate transferase